MARSATAWIVLATLASASAWARGGGGCLQRGTRVGRPGGTVAVERLAVGDVVWASVAGTLRPARVEAVTATRSSRYVEILAGRTVLRVTVEHPIAVGPGVFRTAASLRAGDPILAWDGEALRPLRIDGVRQLRGSRSAYNILVHPGGTFLAGGVVVHNKGCFLPDTSIRLPDGSSAPISTLRAGDVVSAFTPEGRLVTTTVRAITTRQVDSYLVVETDALLLRVTPEHPFFVGHGTFKTIEALHEGDVIYAYDGASDLVPQSIRRIELDEAATLVYNLQTDAPNTFLANGVAVHNKGGGGCFPAGTPVLTPGGDVPIERLAPGDPVVAVGDDGALVVTAVERVYSTRAPLLRLNTPAGTLVTTTDHPLELAQGRFRPAGDLRLGMALAVVRHGRLGRARLRGFRPGGTDEAVFTLDVGVPHTFVAGGFVVHNKGGGFGGGGYHGSGGYHGGGSSDPTSLLVTIAILVVICIAISAAQHSQRGRSSSENLDYLYSEREIAAKRDKTEKLIAFIAKTDAAWAADALREHARSTFVLLQQCWQERDYARMKPLLMPHLYESHCAQLEGMKHDHEINKIDELDVQRIDLVNVRYTDQPDDREFTALFTARARDYYVDDRTLAFLRGDTSPASFQECWTFQLQGGAWLLRDVEQTRESDVLHEENFFAPFTDRGRDQIYGNEAGRTGPSGPWLDEATEVKATRIDRLLNFLVQTDTLWDRTRMVERARTVFIEVFRALEGEENVPSDDLLPDVAANLAAELEARRVSGTTVEFRNLCVRKVELVLVHNMKDDGRDEFTARISAHAQQVIRQGGSLVGGDADVSPFAQYWTFGRLDGEWKLKAVLPPGTGARVIGEENTDQDSSRRQLEWYYTQTRAA